jgi:DNA-directed RNA polymerase specialized sigma24 family protein
MKRERDPTHDELEKLLLWLDSDRDEAGQKLKLIHTRLTRIFVSRGCVEAEMLADEVINRVAVRIDKVKLTYPDALLCCLAFVENVHREYLREQKKIADAVPPPQPRPAEQLEKEDNCLRECMAGLTSRERDLLFRYYGGDKGGRITNRKKLAQELGLSPNALRLQAHRLRKRVRLCLQKCLEEI